MMETIRIEIDGKAVPDFASYQVESDLFAAADAFEIVLVDPVDPVTAGSPILLRLGRRSEMLFELGVDQRLDRRLEHPRALLGKLSKLVPLEGHVGIELRRLLVESMGFEGIYKAVEDYLQPVVKALALSLPLLVAWGDAQRSAVLVGAVYVVLYLASAFASRNAHRLSRCFGGEEGGSRLLWRVAFIAYLVLVPLLYYEQYSLAIAAFIGLGMLIWDCIESEDEAGKPKLAVAHMMPPGAKLQD